MCYDLIPNYQNTEKTTDKYPFQKVNRSTIWRTAKNNRKDGLKYALKDKERSGQSKKYTAKQEAEVIAMALQRFAQGS